MDQLHLQNLDLELDPDLLIRIVENLKSLRRKLEHQVNQSQEVVHLRVRVPVALPVLTVKIDRLLRALKITTMRISVRALSSKRIAVGVAALEKVVAEV